MLVGFCLVFVDVLVIYRGFSCQISGIILSDFYDNSCYYFQTYLIILKMASVLPFTDIIFGNETEAAAYAEVKEKVFFLHFKL